MKAVGFTILTCFLVYSSGRGVDEIAGGNEISIKQAPYQVALVYFGHLSCGGSIISCKFVLSAAHCLPKINPAYLIVRAGSSEYSQGGSEHEVKRVDVHPNYNAYYQDYDAMILTLRNNIKFDSLRMPIKLPFQNEALPAGSIVVTSGWGKTGNDSMVSPVLRMVELKITDQVECSKVHIEFGGVTPRMVCADAASKDSCDGDSGGPLVDLKTQKLVGIVSFGIEAGKCVINGAPSVYTRVASIRSWIKQIVKF